MAVCPEESTALQTVQRIKEQGGYLRSTIASMPLYLYGASIPLHSLMKCAICRNYAIFTAKEEGREAAD